MTWWQVALLVWALSSVPIAFVVARFMRAPAAPVSRPNLQVEPAPAALPDDQVA